MSDLQLLALAAETIHRHLPAIAREAATIGGLNDNDTDRIHALVEEVGVLDLVAALATAAQRLEAGR